jgi:hypothetical protein
VKGKGHDATSLDAALNGNRGEGYKWEVSISGALKAHRKKTQGGKIAQPTNYPKLTESNNCHCLVFVFRTVFLLLWTKSALPLLPCVFSPCVLKHLEKQPVVMNRQCADTSRALPTLTSGLKY